MEINSKRRKGSCDFSDQLEVEGIFQLDREFMKNEELQDLFRQRDALHDQLVNGIPQELKSALSDYCDVNSEIAEHKQKFIYTNAYASKSTHLRLDKNKINLEIRIG